MTRTLDSGLHAARPGRGFVYVALGLLLTLAIGGGVYWKFGLSSADDGTKPPVEPTPRDAPELYTGPPWFRDVTADSAVQFTYRNGEEADQFTILESLGGGVALIDYDGDGLLDIFVTGGGHFDGPSKNQIQGHPCKLYKNLGNFKFQEVTKDVGLDLPWWYTHGVAVADFDCDGWPDLLVTGYGKMALLHNVPDGKKGRRFVDVTEKLGLRDDGWTTGAGWGDLDGDGFPELYVCRYTDWSFANNPPCAGQLPGVKRDVCPPHRFKPLVHALYRNEQQGANVGDRKFRNVSAEHGFKPVGYGLGVLFTDLNGDGRPDVYVTNDMVANFLYMNRGGKLEEKALAAGVALDDVGRATASMGVDAADYDGTGRPALFITNFQRELPSLFRNLGQELFLYNTTGAGLAALGRSNVGWGAGFVDVDNDGWEDLVTIHGHLFRQPAGAPLKQQAALLHNREFQGRRVFKNISDRGGPHFQTPHIGRGLAIGDLDNDGWPDLVISHTNSPVTLLRNQAAEPKHRWLGIRLVGMENRDVVGSTVTLSLDGGKRTLTRFTKGGGGYLSASDQRLLFGIGAAEKISRVTVRWSWGETQTWDNLEANRYHQLHEGKRKTRARAATVRERW